MFRLLIFINIICLFVSTNNDQRISDNDHDQHLYNDPFFDLLPDGSWTFNNGINDDDSINIPSDIIDILTRDPIFDELWAEHQQMNNEPDIEANDNEENRKIKKKFIWFKL